MTILRTEITSFWDGLICKGPKGRRFTRGVISPLKDSITENTNEKAEDFDYGYGNKF